MDRLRLPLAGRAIGVAVLDGHVGQRQPLRPPVSPDQVRVFCLRCGTALADSQEFNRASAWRTCRESTEIMHKTHHAAGMRGERAGKAFRATMTIGGRRRAYHMRWDGTQCPASKPESILWVPHAPGNCALYVDYQPQKS